MHEQRPRQSPAEADKAAAAALSDSAEQRDDPRQLSGHPVRFPDPLVDAVPEMILVNSLI